MAQLPASQHPAMVLSILRTKLTTGANHSTWEITAELLYFSKELSPTANKTHFQCWSSPLDTSVATEQTDLQSSRNSDYPS